MSMEITDYSSVSSFLEGQPVIVPEVGLSATARADLRSASRVFGEYRTVFNQDRVLELSATREDASEFLAALRDLVTQLCHGRFLRFNDLKFVVNTASVAKDPKLGPVYTVHVRAPITATVRLSRLTGDWEFYVEFSGRMAGKVSEGVQREIFLENGPRTRCVDI